MREPVVPVPVLHSLDRRGDGLGVEGQAQIVVGAEQDDRFAVDDTLGGRDHRIKAHVERIGAGLPNRLVCLAIGEVFIEQPHVLRPAPKIGDQVRQVSGGLNRGETV